MQTGPFKISALPELKPTAGILHPMIGVQVDSVEMDGKFP